MERIVSQVEAELSEITNSGEFGRYRDFISDYAGTVLHRNSHPQLVDMDTVTNTLDTFNKGKVLVLGTFSEYRVIFTVSNVKIEELCPGTTSC